MLAVLVSPMVAGEEDAVAALSARSFEPPWNAEELRSAQARDVGRVLVAREGRASLGYAPLGYAVCWVIAGEAEVLTIAVDPAARRRGVGRALLDAVCALAPVVFLDVRRDNVAALALYRGAGFEEVATRAAYYADGVDALVLRRGAPVSAPGSA